jgi:adenine deaminase
LQIASLNAAQYFAVRDLGAIAPGYRADIAVLDDLESMSVVKVIKDGRLVAEDGELRARLERVSAPKGLSIRIGEINARSLEIGAEPGRLAVIGVIPTRSSPIPWQSAENMPRQSRCRH